MRLRSVLLVSVLLVGLLASPAAASVAGHRDRGEIVRVYHPVLAPTLVEGSGLGAVRTFFVPIAADGMNGDGYYMTGTLTTVAVGRPDGQEIRQSNLSFVFGSEADQIVVGGISLYPATAGTLAVGTRTIRPIIGGSGRYDGAWGYVVTTNLGADGWTHVFHLRR